MSKEFAQVILDIATQSNRPADLLGAVIVRCQAEVGPEKAAPKKRAAKKSFISKVTGTGSAEGETA